MPGPLPTGQARRRNAPTITNTTLPASGHDGDVPDPVGTLTKPEREFYDWAWSTPAAAAWHWSDAEIVAEWARLKALAMRYHRGRVKRRGEIQDLPSALLQQITAREDRLMLSPGARLKSRATIADGEPAGAGVMRDGNVVTPERWQRSGAS